MPNRSYNRAAFEFIDEVESLPDVDAILNHLQSILSCYGIDRLLLSGLSEGNFADKTIGVRWPQQFIDLYHRNDWIRVDPVAELARKSAAPFEWDASIWRRERRQPVLDLMGCAADFGIVEGFVVPIHAPACLPSVVSMCGTKVEVPQHHRPSIHLIALYAFDRARRYHEPISRPVCKLSAREREVLIWAAHGKTAAETAEILHITKRTVDEHVQVSCRKLGASNRTHAVAMAIRDRLIGV